MNTLTPAEMLGRAADLLVPPLKEFVVQSAPEPGMSWPEHYERRARVNALSRQQYSLDDPRFLINILAFAWQRLDRRVNRRDSGLAAEIHASLNTNAHNRAAITATSAARTIESMTMLAESLFPQWTGRDALLAMLTTLRTPTAVPAPADVTEAPAPSPVLAEAAIDEADEDDSVDDEWEEIDEDDIPDGYRRTELTFGNLAVTVTYVEALNYALAAQGILPVESVVIRNTSADAAVTVEQLTLHIDNLPRVDDGMTRTDLVVEPHVPLILNRVDLPWVLDHASFADLDESREGHVTLRVSVAGETHSVRGALRLLAHDEWSARPRPELISAFLAPNDPSVTVLVKEVSQFLDEETGSNALTGYEDGPDRITAVAHAAFRALQRRNIALTQPKLSADIDGERVRRPSQVLSSGLASPLELSVLYTSLLEAAGINPVIVLTSDAHFAGFLTHDFSLAELAVTSPEQLQTLGRSGMVIPLDMTALTDGVSPEAATARTEHYWDLDAGAVIAMIDLAACRRRIRPLPGVRVDPNGSRVIEVERPAPLPLPLAPLASATTSATGRRAVYPPRVDRWRRSLLDLSFRNPLLKLGARTGEVLHVPEHALADFENHMAAGHPLTIRPGLGLDPVTNQGTSSILNLEGASVARILTTEHVVHALKEGDALGRTLDRLRRQAATIQEETGNNNLFVTLGALRWKDNQGKDALAPLYLLPVRLEGNSRSSYRVRLDGDEVALPNYCLIQKLHRDHDLEIPALENPPRDASGIDITAVFRTIREHLVRSGKPFAVDPHVRLATLQFSTLEMWRDVSDHWESLGNNPVVRHLIETPTETFTDPIPEPELTSTTEVDEHLPVPSDGSQLKAVQWAREGRTFVLEGPPGTGKSQTITNMIANALVAGRTVLFVAEKQAALDVVRRRLDASGLSPLSLDLHGRELTVRRVRQQLEHAWDHASTNDGTYADNRAQIAAAVKELTAYRERLHGPGPTGTSLWSAHERVLRTETDTSIDLHVPLKILRGEIALSDIEERLDTTARALSDLAAPLATSTWALVGPSTRTIDERSVERAVADLASALSDLSPDALALVGHTDPAAWRSIADTLDLVAQDASVMHASSRDSGGEWSAQLRTLASQLDQFADRHGSFWATLSPTARTANVPLLRQRLIDAHSAGVLKRGRLVKAVTDEIRALTARNELDASHLHPFLNQLEQYIGEGHSLFQRMHELLPHGTEIESGGTQAREFAHRLTTAAAARRALGGGQAFDRYVERSTTAHLDAALDAQALRRLATAWDDLSTALDVTPDTRGLWLRGRSTLTAINESVDAWQQATHYGRYRQLHRSRTAANALAALRADGLDDLTSQLERGHIDAHNLRQRVIARFAAEIRTERLDHTGLDRFDATRRADTIQRLTEAGGAARKAAATSLTDLVRGHHGFDPARPTNELAALRREFQRRKGGSIREMMNNHSGALLKLTPCILMSPASVARYLPHDIPPFDLVIFDEASQIRVADAVGALGRAKAAVIVGDSQQMPPTSAFATSTADDDVESALSDGLVVPQDQDSILKECVDSNIERLWLTWHYRSQDESLIAFSNQTYYKGDLASFPTPPAGETRAEERPRAVTLRNVAGTFDGGRSGTRTNEVEADAIVDEIERMLAHDPATSLGVVTFNAQQQNLLLEKLEPRGGAIRAAMNRDVDALFVKNLENVQGDERDVILFSLAFAPDAQSGQLRLNFGPLTREGGEKRLNVAVTRARRAVTLFSSFDPEHLDLSRTSSLGLRHLRSYMEFARGDEMALEGSRAAARRDVHRADVVASLREAGLHVEESVGLSEFKVDLALRQPGSDAWVAVLLDGVEWAARPTEGDRDVLPREVLVNVMGWPAVERIWLPEWIADKAAVISWMKDAAAIAVPPTRDTADATHPTLPVAPHEPSSTPDDDPSEDHAPAGGGAFDPEGSLAAPTDAAMYSLSGEPDEAGGHSRPVDSDDDPLETNDHSESDEHIELEDFVPFQASELPLPGALDELSDRTVRAAVADRVREIIAAEGPIESWRLARLVGHSYGYRKMSQNRHDDIIALVNRSQRRAEDNALKFIWAEEASPEDYLLVRTSDTVLRTIGEISRAELGNAMLVVLDASGPLPREELRRRTMALFGFKREGQQIRHRLDRTLNWMIRNEWVTCIDGVASLP